MRKIFKKFKVVTDKINMIKSEKLENPDKVYDFIKRLYEAENIDLNVNLHIKAIYLDNNLKTIGYTDIGYGPNTGIIVDLKTLYSVALSCRATNVIICHNHPSGEVKKFSEQTIKLFEGVKEGLKLFDMKALDLIVFSNDTYLSYENLK